MLVSPSEAILCKKEREKGTQDVVSFTCRMSVGCGESTGWNRKDTEGLEHIRRCRRERPVDNINLVTSRMHRGCNEPNVHESGQMSLDWKNTEIQMQINEMMGTLDLHVWASAL